MCSTLGEAPGLSQEHYNKLKRLVWDKQCRLLRKFVNYGCKSSITLGLVAIEWNNNRFFSPTNIRLG
jgi:hypothetical protein